MEYGRRRGMTLKDDHETKGLGNIRRTPVTKMKRDEETGINFRH